MRWKLQFEPDTAPSMVLAKEPETMVRQIYQHLGEGERAQALVTARNLALQFPNFQLGQLLYADLLNISSQQPVQGVDLEADARPSALRRLEELVLEAKRRIMRPAPEALQSQIPASVAYLAAQQPYIAAVDASRSRLYWFANRTGSDGQLKLELIKETYVSVGINGVGKIKEGDGKTPVGVYFIQKNLPGASLPDLFGVGALTLNYPNAVDAMRNKTGSGIWLHGTPSAQYSRAPEATDGCVVLSNPVMEQLLSLPGWRMTPVIIAEKLDWIAAGQVPTDYTHFKPSLDRWIADRQTADAEKLKTYYSQRFERDALDLDHWWPRLAQTLSMQRNAKPLDVISVLHWNDGEETMVVTMSDPNIKDKRQPAFLRTYWQKEAGQWKLVFEGPT
ncbi:murein L,D-transpeptidase family protein [Limnohabitans sp. Jir72]|uniref:L,D-transpeptidase family protein n=1 Tax=Limnohabitans sp. Jir72 TaxID=1977909 RepID=UPI00130503EE|nr:L,D-transpeptidase [Limnohabitans sp. Jir72]